MSVLLAGAIFAGCGGNGNSDGDKDDGDAHVHTYQWSVATSGLPTQTEAGTATGTCTANDSTVSVEIPALTDSRYTVENNTATATEAGTGTYSITINDPTYGEIRVTFTAETPATGGEAQDTSTPLPAANKIYLVGDSTVCSFTDNYYYLPRYGYGTQIAEYFNVTTDQVENLALSGRSSYSFVSENNYTELNQIGEGDYLFIGFGHNDEKYEIARYTDPTLGADDSTTMIGTYDTGRPVSFKYVLKHYYIDVALAAGATPVLCTPISRLYEDQAKYSSDHVTSDKTGYTDATATPNVTTDWRGGNYAEAVRELGVELGLTVIDLTSITRADYMEKGYAEASKNHAATGAKWVDDAKTVKEATGIDGTHTNLYGAKTNAYYIADAIKNSDLSLKNNVKTNVTKPVYEDYAEACINPNYEIPEQEPFNPSTDVSERWTAVTGSVTDSTTGQVYQWYGTAFGESVPLTSFSINQGTDENGVTFTLSAAAGKGKIASASDVLAAVFIQVPQKTAFTVSASAEVTAFGGNQAGFGIMVRDDIYIDYANTVSSNYVNAGVRASSTAVVMCYARVNGALSDGTKDSSGSSLATGTYDLSLARTSQSITANIGNYTYNAVSDFDLAASDGEYVYVCLWVTRGTTVTFSNISFASGEWQQA